LPLKPYLWTLYTAHCEGNEEMEIGWRVYAVGFKGTTLGICLKTRKMKMKRISNTA